MDADAVFDEACAVMVSADAVFDRLMMAGPDSPEWPELKARHAELRAEHTMLFRQFREASGDVRARLQ
jgi:hypothetical protein